MTLTMADGSIILSPLAQVWITFGKYQIHHVVAVAEEAPEEVLLGLDTGFFDLDTDFLDCVYLLQLAMDNNSETMSMVNE